MPLNFLVLDKNKNNLQTLAVLRKLYTHVFGILYIRLSPDYIYTYTFIIIGGGKMRFSSYIGIYQLHAK